MHCSKPHKSMIHYYFEINETMYMYHVCMHIYVRMHCMHLPQSSFSNICRYNYIQSFMQDYKFSISAYELSVGGNFLSSKHCIFQRLWCSWAVKGPTHSFYFGGDTGYNKIAFHQIGKKYGPFSLSALPIGAYEPRLSTFDK